MGDGMGKGGGKVSLAERIGQYSIEAVTTQADSTGQDCGMEDTCTCKRVRWGW